MRVLLATDGSKDAQAALAFLQALPLPPSSTVRIAIVVTLPSLAFDMPPAKEFESSALEAARGVLEEARTRLGGGGLTTEADAARGTRSGPFDSSSRSRFLGRHGCGCSAWSSPCGTRCQRPRCCVASSSR